MSEDRQLDDFLSALGGFLGNQPSPIDEGNFRFLSMFCRSIGATDGHFLNVTDTGALVSDVGIGVGKAFSQQFNKATFKNASSQPSPLDDALKQKEVVAVVDLSQAPSIPKWFMDIMNQHGFNSLVAVPLVGRHKVKGIMCAYYRDVCLFDQNTLNHLMAIGRMMAAATDKPGSNVETPTATNGHGTFDDFLNVMTKKSLTQVQLFQWAVKQVKDLVPVIGFICGPVRKSGSGNAFIGANGFGIEPKLISNVYKVPPAIEKKLKPSWNRDGFVHMKESAWGEFYPLVNDQSTYAIFQPLIVQGKVQGLMMGWTQNQNSSPEGVNQFERLAKMISMGLVSIPDAAAR